MSDPDRLALALDRFDALNSEDPRHDIVDGIPQPRELVYGRRMSDRLRRFAPEASVPLRLAVRAQHIARWRIPRTSYPEGRKGYKRWRAELMRVHADIAAEILGEVGFDSDTIDAVGRLLRKEGIKRNPDAQTLEDVACLVFLEHYFDDFARDHDDEKLVDILRKTWRKMSAAGHAAALQLPLGSDTTRLVEKALDS